MVTEIVNLVYLYRDELDYALFSGCMREIMFQIAVTDCLLVLIGIRNFALFSFCSEYIPLSFSCIQSYLCILKVFVTCFTLERHRD